MTEWQIKAALKYLDKAKDRQARLWLDVTDGDGATVSIVINAWEYQLLADECLLVTNYVYTDDEENARLFWKTPRRHAGLNCIPFESIKLITVFERGME